MAGLNGTIAMGTAVKLRSGFAATEEAVEPGAGNQGRALPSWRSLVRLLARGPVLFERPVHELDGFFKTAGRLAAPYLAESAAAQ
jgi:hypothetical protein